MFCAAHVYRIPYRYNFELYCDLDMSDFLYNFVTPIVTTMNNRLKQFLAAENISQSQFADSIDVVRASVSHVLSGRNNPSYDFIKAIMKSYPSLNMEWLILGKGKMYKEQSNKQEESDSLFSDYDLEDINTPEADIPLPVADEIINIQPTNDINSLDETPKTISNQRSVVKIIVLYDDGSFQEM